MSETLWLVCYVVLIFLACLDYFLLWKLSFGKGSPYGQKNSRGLAGLVGWRWRTERLTN